MPYPSSPGIVVSGHNNNSDGGDHDLLNNGRMLLFVALKGSFSGAVWGEERSECLLSALLYLTNIQTYKRMDSESSSCLKCSFLVRKT